MSCMWCGSDEHNSHACPQRGHSRDDWEAMLLPGSGPPRPGPAPLTLGGRMHLVSQLLAPEYVETCPHCGSEIVRRGEPLISREGALELLEGEER